MRLAVLVLVGACNFSTAVTKPTDAAAIDSPDAPEAPMCFDGRCRKKTFTIHHEKVAGPLVKFPVYIKLADPDLAMAQPSGNDFVFIAVDGTTVLPYERERFANNELLAWVAVPTLSNTVDTTIHLYYGSGTASDSQNKAAVWDADYQGVWHLAEATGGTGMIRDATTKGNHGTDLGGLAIDVDAKLGRGAQFDGVDDHIRIPQATSLTMTAGLATLGMWVNWNQATGTDYQRLLLSTNSFVGDGSGMEWATNPMGQYYYYPSDCGGTSNNYAAMATPFVDGTWHHLVVTQDFSTKTVKLYIDGALQTLTSDLTPTNWANLMSASEWHWGGFPPRNAFAGKMDEIRVSKIVRSTEWTATEYANQSSPQTFYKID